VVQKQPPCQNEMSFVVETDVVSALAVVDAHPCVLADATNESMACVGDDGSVPAKLGQKRKRVVKTRLR
jgi:hypothetical protein